MGVKNKKRGRPPEGDGNLSASTIISVARDQMLQKGKKVSIRALARALEVDPMAIYHYFENKNALLEAVATDIMGQIYTPDPSQPWEDELEKLSESYITLLANHPGLLETFIGITNIGIGHVHVFQTRFDIVVNSIGLDQVTKDAALDLLVDFLHGFALAIHTSSDVNEPDISSMKKPFSLYIKALRNSVSDR